MTFAQRGDKEHTFDSLPALTIPTAERRAHEEGHWSFMYWDRAADQWKRTPAPPSPPWFPALDREVLLSTKHVRVAEESHIMFLRNAPFPGSGQHDRKNNRKGAIKAAQEAKEKREVLS